MNEEIESATPALVEQTEQVQTVETQSTDATAEKTQEAEQTETQEAREKRTPWFERRIGELTREKYEARRAAEDATRRAQELEARIAQQPQGEQPQTADVMSIAERIANERLAEREYEKAASSVVEQGKSEFPDFQRSIANLTMLGMDDNFVQVAIDSEAPHKVIHYLGQEANLDEAARILSLPPAKQARELARLEYKLNQPPPPKPVSKAPAPINPIGSGGVTDSGLSDELPIDEWMRRNAKRK